MAAGGSGLPCRPAWKKSSGESFPSLLLGSPLDAFDRERRGRRNADNALHCDTCNSRRLGGLIRLYLPSAPSVSVDGWWGTLAFPAPDTFCWKLDHLLLWNEQMDLQNDMDSVIFKSVFRLGAPLLAHSLSAFKEMYYWKNLYRYICVYPELYTSFNTEW